MNFGFSTLGCANYHWEEIAAVARCFPGYRIEVRGVAGRMDLPDYLQAEPGTPAALRELWRRLDLNVMLLGTGFVLGSATSLDRAALLDWVPWAEATGVPWLRVFGAESWANRPIPRETLDRAVENLAWWRAERARQGWRVDLLLETHGAFSGSPQVEQLQSALATPVPLLWDTHHTWSYGGEDPEHTWARLGPWVRSLHLKDSVPQASARHPYTYVIPGLGTMPLRRCLELMLQVNFNGCLTLEWERQWHPYLPPLEDALAAYHTLVTEVFEPRSTLLEGRAPSRPDR